MRVIPPLTILDAMLVSTGAAEPWAPSAYSAGTTYAAGAIVTVAADYQNYQSLAGGNTGNTPSASPLWWKAIGPTEVAYNGSTTYALGATVSSSTAHRVYEALVGGESGNPLPVWPETETTKWIDVGPTNRWAMFDTFRNTKTVGTSPLVVKVAPGIRIKAVALLGLEANEVTVSMDSADSPSTNHYSHTENLQIREYAVADWYEYFFAEFGARAGFVLFNLPLYSADGLL